MIDHHEETEPTGTESAEDEATTGTAGDDDGPDVTELDQDPAYNPDSPLKDLKGG